MRATLIKALLPIIFCIGFTSAQAAVPQTLNYQGQLADASGVPVNATVSMTFSLYTVPAGATPPAVWSEVQSVTVTNGLYSIALGQITPLTPDLFSAPLYLGISVGTDAEMTPRIAMSSSATALRAALADTATTAYALAPTATVLATKVSYTGATENLDLGTHNGTFAGLTVTSTGLNSSQPAEFTGVPILTHKLATAGAAPYQIHQQSYANQGPGAGTYNHAVLTGFNVGRHSTLPSTPNKPSLIMGMEDNWYEPTGPVMEWYVEYFSPDGTSVQMLRPFFTRVSSASNTSSHATTIFEIGADGQGAVIFSTGLLELARITPAAFSLVVPMNATTMNIVTDSINRMSMGVMTSLPSNSHASYIGWSDGAAGQAGDLLLIPRTSIDGAIRFFTGTPSPSEVMTILASGNIGIGTTNPSATLHLKAGAATAGSAPIKIASGTLNTTAEAGTIEYSDAWYMTDSTPTRRAIQSTNYTAPEFSITPPASTVAYQNVTGYPLDVLITNGTVTLIEFSRNGTAWYPTGTTAGIVPLSPLDRVRVTYTSAPTMTGIPR